MVKRLPIAIKIAPIYLVIVAAALVPMFSHRAETARVQAAGTTASSMIASSASASKQDIPEIAGKPSRIIIPSVGIDVTVVDGRYIPATTKWTVAHDTANYATNTPVVSNKQGTPLLYGHWFKWVFGPTKDMQVGAIAYVYTANGHVMKYRYEGADVTNPSDTQVFAGLNSTHGLKLLTCEGTWAQHRRIMNFSYQGASS